MGLHFGTLMELCSGNLNARSGSALDMAGAQGTDTTSLCLQLLSEVSRAHSVMSKVFNENLYTLKYLAAAPTEAVADDGIEDMEDKDNQQEKDKQAEKKIEVADEEVFEEKPSRKKRSKPKGDVIGVPVAKKKKK